MYKFDRDHQFTLSDFNQPIGLKMNPENRWVLRAATIPWHEIEIRYAGLFPSKTGMPGYEDKIPFVPSLLVEFRKRLTPEILDEINEMIADYNHPDDPDGGDDGSDPPDSGPDNHGTIILDATCAPQNISFPQDVNFLNEGRENLEAIID